MGLLRKKKEYSLGTHFVPALYHQLKLEMIQDEDRTAAIEETLQVGLVGRAIRHKKAIQAEMQRREDLKNEKRREEEEAAKAKERRRERRMCLKEQKRIQELSEVLMSEQREYAVSVPIYDLRNFQAELPSGIYTFGGFVGELVMTLNALNEHMTKGLGHTFDIKADTIMRFLEELLIDGYPQGICFIKVDADPLNDVEKNEESVTKQAELAANRLAKGEKV
jgi:hypothetical protein